MKLWIRTTTEIDAPDDATHVDQDLESPEFYKMTEVGVAGEHWWRWKNREWVLVSHRKPEYVRPIPVEWRVDLLDLLCLADQTIMQLHGCFPLSGPTYEKMKKIREVTGENYSVRNERAKRAMK